jgi:hypothetical protein
MTLVLYSMQSDSGSIDLFDTVADGLQFLLESWHEDDPRLSAYTFWEDRFCVATLVADPNDAEIAVFHDLKTREIKRFRCVYVTEGNKTVCKITPLHR